MTASTLTSDIKSVMSPFDQFTTAVGVIAEVPGGKFDGRL
jgi:hypothetical protein